jgi:hypothetical protein
MVQRIKNIIIGMLLTLVLTIGFSTPEAKADDYYSPAGTYVLDTYYPPSPLAQNFAGKRVITLTEDGQFFVIDSNQGGTFGVPPAAQTFPNNRFTSGQGIWKKFSSSRITAKVFNFNFPDPKEISAKVKIAQANYIIDQVNTNGVTGTFTITTKPLEETQGEQLENEKSQSYRFYFNGKKQDILFRK